MESLCIFCQCSPHSRERRLGGTASSSSAESHTEENIEPLWPGGGGGGKYKAMASSSDSTASPTYNWGRINVLLAAGICMRPPL